MNSTSHPKTNQGLQLFVAASLSLFALFGLQACGGGGGGGTPAAPTLSVAAASGVEGDTGATDTLDFALTLSAAASSDVTVTYSTSDDTATTADSDYVASTGATLVIPAGQTSGTISITVTGDDTLEFDESFNLQISNAQNATISGGSQSVTGTILSDDSLAGYYTSSAITTVNEDMGTLDIPAGDFQVIADINRLSIIDLTNNLIYIADINAFDTPASFTANARIYKDGNYTDDNANISGVINVDQSLDLTLIVDSGNAGGDGNYTATTGVMTLAYSTKNGDVPLVFDNGSFWQDSGPITTNLGLISSTATNITTNSDVSSTSLNNCRADSVDFKNIITEQIGRIRSFSVPSVTICAAMTPLDGYLTSYDTVSANDTVLFIWFNDDGAHAANLSQL